MRTDPYKQAEEVADWATVALVWTVVLVGILTWAGALFVAGHFVLKYW